MFAEFTKNNQLVVDASASISLSKIPLVNKIPVIRDTAGVSFGYSKVIGYSVNEDYFHIGVGGSKGTSILGPISINAGIGFVTPDANGYDPGDYGGPFYDFSSSFLLGVDHCGWENGSSATLITIGTDIGITVKMDYYKQIK